jgi:serpin B
MNTMGSLRLSFIPLLMATLMGSPAGAQAANNVPALAAGNNAFAFDLYGRLKAKEGNLFFSPYSISGCLAMTYAGARGTTASQMAQTLHFTNNQAQLAASFGELQRQLNALEAKKDIQLSIANGLWGQKAHPFLPAFLDVAKTTYQAQVNQVDFRTQAEPVRREINDWVEQQTQGKITNLLQPGMVDPMTRLVLVNAIYFKGKWAHQFNKTNTADGPFMVTSDQRVQAPLMHLKADFKYAEIESAQLLELPYAGGDLSMVVVLPKDVGGLQAVELMLNDRALNTWLGKHEQQVDVFLPRFKLTGEFGLAKTLAEMGMKDAFTGAADFSGMDGERDLFISAVVHKAYADVNEEGTEAAAATGAIMKLKAVRPQPVPVFRADHPFVFLIRNPHSGSILFMGRVVDPTKGVS